MPRPRCLFGQKLMMGNGSDFTLQQQLRGRNNLTCFLARQLLPLKIQNKIGRQKMAAFRQGNQFRQPVRTSEPALSSASSTSSTRIITVFLFVAADLPTRISRRSSPRLPTLYRRCVRVIGSAPYLLFFLLIKIPENSIEISVISNSDLRRKVTDVVPSSHDTDCAGRSR